MADATTDQNTDQTQDDLIPRSEAQKAFKDRDAAKERARGLEARIKELEAKVLTDEDRQQLETFREQAAKAEEERAKKAGEYESLKRQQQERLDQMAKEHQRVLADREATYSKLSERFKNTVKLAQFGAATDYFGGGESSKTILDVDLAMAALGRWVEVEDMDTDPLGYRVIVRKPNGDTIFGADGNPAPFTEAIGELIKALPNRDRILRGSGKTGSGSSGGSTVSAKDADSTELIARARQGDKDALDALKKRRAASGGLVMGSALTR